MILAIGLGLVELHPQVDDLPFAAFELQLLLIGRHAGRLLLVLDSRHLGFASGDVRLVRLNLFRAAILPLAQVAELDMDAVQFPQDDGGAHAN